MGAINNRVSQGLDLTSVTEDKDGEAGGYLLKNTRADKHRITVTNVRNSTEDQVERSYKLRMRQDNDGQVTVSTNTVHDKGSSSEQVISILSNEKGLGGRTRGRCVKNML